uniref:Uncharacterized protein n=1 Tax=Arundo donax TaxID=35708 RepID=A0A0A9HF11_ARUDO
MYAPVGFLFLYIFWGSRYAFRYGGGVERSGAPILIHGYGKRRSVAKVISTVWCIIQRIGC